MIVWPISSPETSTEMWPGMSSGLAWIDEGVQDLVDDALLAEDQRGLALEHDRHVDRDHDVDVDGEEVDVQHVAAHRVALHVLHEGLGLLRPDLQREQGVEALVGGEGGPQVAPLDRERHGVGAPAVDHGGHLAVGPQAAGGGGTGGAAGLGREGDVVSHRISYF